MELWRRLQYLLQRKRADRELADELEFHREMAARAGRNNVGSALKFREEAREAWGWMWIDRLAQDFRYAARMLRKSPGFTVAAVAMLALGIGVNVAAFGFFNLIVLSVLPVRDPDSLVSLERRSPERYATDFPYPVMEFYREHSRTLSAVLALQATNLRMGEAGQTVRAHFVTANYFTELGGEAQVGRVLEPGIQEPVVVLSHGYWQRQFGGDKSVVGKPVRLNQQTATVIGVAEEDFSGLNLNQVEMWLPIEQQPLFVPGSQMLTDWASETQGVLMWGRLRSGLTPAAVEQEFRGLAQELRQQHPNDIWKNEGVATEAGGYVRLNGGGHRGTGTPVNPRTKMWPVVLMVGSLVLLILAVACANLGSLLMARGVARQREISIRVAVGAGSGRLLRQLLTESLLLAALGTVAGVGLGYAVLRNLIAWTGAPEWMRPVPDWRVMLFAAGLAVLTAVLFGLAPAWQVARQQSRQTLARQVLIGAQVAASCVLLIVAGLLVRALNHAVTMNPGFEYQQVVTISPELGEHGYSPVAAKTYLETAMGRIRDLPGMQAVSLVDSAPLGNRTSTVRVVIDGRQVDLHLNHVDPGYFETMKIRLLRGRNFRTGEQKVLIVSDSFVRKQWPAADGLGKTFPMGDEQWPIVGIAASARTGALNDPDAAEAYLPIEPTDWPSLQILARTSGSPENVLSEVAGVAKGIDPKFFPEVRTMKSSFRRKMEPAERSAAATAVMGLTALALACLGIVGLVTYAVSQRTKEIGIRMALGAKPWQVIGSVLWQFSRPVLIGLAVGVAGAAGLSQLLRRELYGLSHLDAVAYGAAVGVFVVAAGLAAWWPARRALRVDPLTALRYE